MLTDQEIEDIGEERAPYVDHRFARAIESAATAPLLARMAEMEAANEEFGKRQEWWNSRMLEMERELEEVRKDAELLNWMEKNIRAHAAVWVLPCGDDLRFVQVRHFGDCASYPVAEGLRQAIRAAIKEQT